MSASQTSQMPSLALVQMRCGDDPAQNLAAAQERVREAAGKGAQIVCLQELFRSRYFCHKEDAAYFDLAESVPGPSTQAFCELARELDVAIVVPLFERRGEGIYHNTAVVIDAGGKLLGKYRKMHIPDDPLYYEKFYFTPGDLGFQVFQTRFARIAPLICWDQWFPEGARLAALAGAQILLYPTAIGWIPQERAEVRPVQKDAWQTIQRAHAIANGLFVAAANRVGREHEVEFWGGSFVCDPFGKVLAQAGQDEEILLARCELAAIEETRRAWPFLRDRRIDAYGGLSRRLIDE